MGFWLTCHGQPMLSPLSALWIIDVQRSNSGTAMLPGRDCSLSMANATIFIFHSILLVPCASQTLKASMVIQSIRRHFTRLIRMSLSCEVWGGNGTHVK